MSRGLQEGQGNIHTLDMNPHDPCNFGLDINCRKGVFFLGWRCGLDCNSCSEGIWIDGV